MKFALIAILSVFISCSHSSLLKSKVVVAHRGASGYLPEHSLAGVAMSHSWGVDYIEADVVLTKDHHPVVLHDIHLDTTTNVAKKYSKRKRRDGRYYAIDFTLREIKRLKLNERINLKTGKRVFKDRYPKSNVTMRVPTLSEFIELVQGLNKSTKKDVGVYVEMKSPEFHKKHRKDIAKVTIKTLRKYGYDTENSKAILQCFFPPTLKRLKTKFKTKIPLVLLIADNSWKESSVDYDYYLTEKGIKEVHNYVDGLGPWIPQLKSSDIMALSKKYNLKVHAYTHRIDSLPEGVTNSQLLDYLFIEAQVDGVFSDFADNVMKYLEK
jgi:glycerophosphoryl diester phosphodiesterase